MLKKACLNERFYMIIIMLEFMLILSLFWGKFSDWEIRKRGGGGGANVMGKISTNIYIAIHWGPWIDGKDLSNYMTLMYLSPHPTFYLCSSPLCHKN